MRLKITNPDNGWHGQDGEFVRMDNGSEAPAGPDDVVVVRMPGDRLVEFKAHELSPVEDEPEADEADTE